MRLSPCNTGGTGGAETILRLIIYVRNGSSQKFLKTFSFVAAIKITMEEKRRREKRKIFAFASLIEIHLTKYNPL